MTVKKHPIVIGAQKRFQCLAPIADTIDPIPLRLEMPSEVQLDVWIVVNDEEVFGQGSPPAPVIPKTHEAIIAPGNSTFNSLFSRRIATAAQRSVNEKPTKLSQT